MTIGKVSIYQIPAFQNLGIWTVFIWSGAFLIVGALLALAVVRVLQSRHIKSDKNLSLSRSEERFRLIFEYAPDAYYLCDLTGKFLAGNKAAEEMVGYPRDELIGKSFLKLNLLPPNQIPKAAKLLIKNSLGQATGPDEFLLNRKDGSQVIVSIRTHQVTIEGQPLVLGIARDITKQREIEKKAYLQASALNAAANAIMITDRSGEIIWANQAFSQLTGYANEEVIGQTPSLLGSGEQSDPYYKELWKTIRSGQIWKGEIINRRKDGKHYIEEQTITPIEDSDGKISHFVAIKQDITDRKQAELALRQSEERYALAALGSNDGLWDWDLKTNRIYLSPRWKGILGYPDEEIAESPDFLFNRIHRDDRDKFKIDISAHIEGITPHLECEHRMYHKNGTSRWMLTRGLAVRNKDGVAYRIAGSLTDITEHKRIEKQLVHDAFHDTLTGLPNRALFMDRLDRAIERAKRRRSDNFAILFLDIDRFKLVNDSYGHTVGDELLISIAERLTSCVRSADTVARLGGDEFAVLIESLEYAEDATHATERIQIQLNQPFYIGEHELYTSASIGLVLSEFGKHRPDDILRDADIAMYRAKMDGKARAIIFQDWMRDRAIARMELETDLRRAIGQREFVIHFQPIISLTSDRIMGFEALVRWKHPYRGLIYPAEFIDIAEETGLIIPIDWWVLRNVCEQLKEWQDRFPSDPPLFVSVNLSCKHFNQNDLLLQVQNILKATGLGAECLKLEITERAIMDHSETAIMLLESLREIGVQIQIDDFGTGYSSLGYLQRLPIDAIKIDRSFIQEMGMKKEKPDLVSTIVYLAHDLGMHAIAEGVETSYQLDQLKSFSCEFGQGYYFAKPMDNFKVEKLLAGIQHKETDRLVRGPGG